MDTENKLRIKTHITELPVILKYCEEAGITPIIIGLPGIAKTSAVRQYAGQRPLSCIILSHHSPVDIAGLPALDESKSNYRLVPLGLLPKEKDSILFLDEFNTAAKSCQNVAMQIVLDKRVGEWVAPEGLFIVLAANSIKHRCHTERMSSAMANRLMWIYLEPPNVETFTTYMIENNFDPKTIAFIQYRPDLIHSLNPEAWDGESGFASPRTWEMTSNLTKTNPPKSIRQKMFQGLLGEATAFEYLAFLEMIETNLPSIDDIFSDPQNAPIPEEVATKYAVITALISHLKKTNSPEFFHYMLRFPKEFQFFAFKMAHSQKRNIIASNPQFQTWIINNTHIVNQ